MLAAGGWTRSGQVCRIHDFRVAFLCCRKRGRRRTDEETCRGGRGACRRGRLRERTEASVVQAVLEISDIAHLRGRRELPRGLRLAGLGNALRTSLRL